MKMLDDPQYSVVFAFVRIGFEGLGSYGPKSSVERAMVSMCSRPVPPSAIIR